ncbi:MAG: peptidoglycan-binding protein [Patescibacteria group bacterium]
MKTKSSISVFVLLFTCAFLLFPSASFAQSPNSKFNSVFQNFKSKIVKLWSKAEVFKKPETNFSKIAQLAQILRFGTRSTEVEDLQKLLKQSPEIYPEGLVTGYFGPLTEAAIKRFNEKNGIKSVVVVGQDIQANVTELKESNNTVKNSGADVSESTIFTSDAGVGSFGGSASGGSSGGGGGGGATPAEPATPATPSSGGGGATPATPATPAEPHPDVTPPVISDVQAIDITETSAVINWDTDELATSEVRWDVNSLQLATTTNSVVVTENTINHSINLAGLLPGKKYTYVAISKDVAGNITTSDEQSLTTVIPGLVFSGWENKKIVSGRLGFWPMGYKFDVAASDIGYGITYVVSGSPDSQGGVYLSLIYGDGDKMRNTIIASEPNGFSHIVWNGLEYGVIWPNQFARLDNKGKKLQGNVEIVGFSAEKSEEFRVVWNGSGYTIFWLTDGYAPRLTFIDDKGATLFSNVPVSTDSIYGSVGRDIVLTSGGGLNAIAWADSRSGQYQTYAALFDNSGNKLTSDIPVSNEKCKGDVDQRCYPTHIFYDGESESFNLVWRSSQYRNPKEYFSKIGIDGVVIGDPILVLNDQNVRQGSWANSGSEYVALWSDDFLTRESRLPFLRFDNLGNRLGESLGVIDPAAAYLGTKAINSPMIVSGFGKYAAFWLDNRNYSDGNRDIYFATPAEPTVPKPIIDPSTVCPNGSFACEDFESYSVGSLAGGEGGAGWGNAWNNVNADAEVVQDGCFKGSKCIKSIDGSVGRSFYEALDTGSAVFALKKMDTGDYHYVGLTNFAGDSVALIRWDGPYLNIQDGPRNTLAVTDAAHVLWQTVEVQFGGYGGLCSVSQYRARVDGGAWSSCANQVVPGPVVGIGVSSGPTGLLIDEISINPVLVESAPAPIPEPVLASGGSAPASESAPESSPELTPEPVPVSSETPAPVTEPAAEPVPLFEETALVTEPVVESDLESEPASVVEETPAPAPELEAPTPTPDPEPVIEPASEPTPESTLGDPASVTDPVVEIVPVVIPEEEPTLESEPAPVVEEIITPESGLESPAPVVPDPDPVLAPTLEPTPVPLITE